ncbi:drug:h+ antiporter [Crucibulum laeve]|uniref:Drug:h+ antiporter n=1 Tax=Crucibulum laeve TaxID=68775 RepID=A0A5C3LYR0_9AGAR|nr:drug:h+ antiporter [Crucibulum laeve]
MSTTVTTQPTTATSDDASSLREKRDHDDHHDSRSLFSSNDNGIVAHAGVKTVEATHRVYGKYSKWFLFISLGLAAYIYSLDGTTTWNYLAFAASEFGDHGLISPVQVAQSIIVACGKPVIAKIADVSSRGTAYVIVLLFYVVGYIVIASAHNIQTVAGGIIIYAVGYTGLQLLTQIIIADITTLKWRGLVSGLMSLPFVINAFVGSNIAANVITGAGWRWGYGMFAILVPVALGPLIITLLWAERKARKLGVVTANGLTTPVVEGQPFFKRILVVAEKLDVVGLLLIGTSVSLILLPLTLSKSAKGGWNNASMIAMLVVGIVVIPMYVFWEFKFAKFPVIARRFVMNRTVVCAALIGSLDFISFYIVNTYLYSFIIIVKPWSLVNATYFSQTQTVALTVFGITAGLAMRYLHSYKWLLIGGLAIRLLGCGLMIHSRGANSSDAEIVWTQLLQGIGGGFAAVSIQVAAQASVPHADVGMVTAVVLLITEIGGAIGSAIAGAIWTNLMPGRIAHHLPFLTADLQTQLYGSIVSVYSYPRGTPIREGAIMAYDDVMKIMTIVGTVFAVFPLLLSLIMPNWYLGDQQNAVEQVDLAGGKVDQPALADKTKNPAFWRREETQV